MTHSEHSSHPAGRTICVVTETFAPQINGVANTLSHLIARLTARGHQVLLVRPRQLPHDKAGATPGTLLVPALPLPVYRGLGVGYPAARCLRKRWADQRPDVLYVATEGPLGWAAVSEARRAAIPVVSGFHTNFHAYSRHYGLGFLAPAVYAYLRRFHARAQRTVVPTQAGSEALNHDGFAHVDVVGRGVDIDLFNPVRRDQTLRTTWGAGPDDPVVLHVGRVAAEKNLPLALRAFAAMREAVPNARMVIVGEGPLAAHLAGKHPEVIFCGFQSQAQLAVYYASADIFLFPSETETFGNVVLEAMASGLATVAFDYAAAREAIAAGEGFLVPFGDHDAFVATYSSVIATHRALAPVRLAARAAAERRAWPQIVERFETVLLEACRGGIQ